MHYSATLKAGIQMDEVKEKITDKEVIVTIPHAKVLEKPQVDPDSIKFMDEKRAIFNWQTKEDAKKAISLRVAGCDSSTCRPKISCSDTGRSVGNEAAAAPRFEVSSNDASSGRPKRLAARAISSGWFCGSTAR